MTDVDKLNWLEQSMILGWRLDCSTQGRFTLFLPGGVVVYRGANLREVIEASGSTVTGEKE